MISGNLYLDQINAKSILHPQGFFPGNTVTYNAAFIIDNNIIAMRVLDFFGTVNVQTDFLRRNLFIRGYIGITIPLEFITQYRPEIFDSAIDVYHGCTKSFCYISIILSCASTGTIVIELFVFANIPTQGFP